MRLIVGLILSKHAKNKQASKIATIPFDSQGSSSKIKAVPSEDEDDKEDDDEEEEATEIDLDGIDDDEIDGLILNEEEVKVKTLVWCRLNAMYLQVCVVAQMFRQLLQL